jgi:hypothetical protein
MTSTLVGTVVRSLLVTGFVLGAVQGCGSSGSGSSDAASPGDYVTICTNACERDALCLGDAGASETMAPCMSMCTTKVNSEKGCAAEAQIAQAVQNCLGKTACSDFVSCFGAVDDTCSTGAGGASGAGGKSGAAGASGAGGAGVPADCTACTMAATCCTAAHLPATECNMIPSTSACNAATGTTQSGDITACQTILSLAGTACP